MGKSTLTGKCKVGTEGENFVLVPPDGGYGWVVAFGFFLILGTEIPVVMVFGLYYNDIFTELGFSPTMISILLNMNIGIGYGFALFNAPLIRRFGYRKMAVLGSALLSGGMVLTSMATTILQFAIVYGIVASLGVGILTQVTQVAINSYFKEKKGKAVGIAMTAVGVCMILLPQLSVALLNTYGPRGTTLIMAGVLMQSFIGAATFQPIKRHMKRKLVDPEITITLSQGLSDKTGAKSPAHEAQTATNADKNENARTGDKADQADEPLLTSKVSSKEETEYDVGYSLKEDSRNREIDTSKNSQTSMKISLRKATMDVEEPRKLGLVRDFLTQITTVLDLSLMTNAVYANVILGVSLSFASETNFSMMTPLILVSMGFSADKVATIMSTMSLVDIAARFVAPFVQARFKIKERTMYFISLILLVILRSLLVLLRSFESVLMLGVGIGIAKGIRNVYSNIVIPSYVPTERLASAIGLQMTFSALMFFCFGPILGLAVEAGGNYDACVLALSGFTLIAVTMWFVELFVSRNKSSRQPTDSIS